MTQTFTELVQEQLTHARQAKAAPDDIDLQCEFRMQTGVRVGKMRSLLDGFLGYCSSAFAFARSWRMHPRLLSSSDFSERKGEAIDYAIAFVLNDCETKIRISKPLTGKTAFFAYNEVRKWAKREKFASDWRMTITPEELDALVSGRENALPERMKKNVRMLNDLYGWGLIDLVEYYLMLSGIKGVSTKQASEWIGWSDAKGRGCKHDAKRRIEAFSATIKKGMVIVAAREPRKILRQVDHDLLMKSLDKVYWM